MQRPPVFAFPPGGFGLAQQWGSVNVNATAGVGLFPSSIFGLAFVTSPALVRYLSIEPGFTHLSQSFSYRLAHLQPQTCRQVNLQPPCAGPAQGCGYVALGSPDSSGHRDEERATCRDNSSSKYDRTLLQLACLG